MRILFVFKVFNLKPFLWSHKFARLKMPWKCTPSSLMLICVIGAYMHAIIWRIYVSLVSKELTYEYAKIYQIYCSIVTYPGTCIIWTHPYCNAVLPLVWLISDFSERVRTQLGLTPIVTESSRDCSPTVGQGSRDYNGEVGRIYKLRWDNRNSM